ncbi:transcriptional regulator [Gammaproteobacteria bacterium 45_16_T64]|nr:transcriptional regulator [Gammaproteobacteria bacterium 45_16_T64]
MTNTELDGLAENASRAAALLKAMSNEKRLMILCSLQEGEMSVSQLNEIVPLSQSALSQHLSSLRNANLVSIRRDSQTIYYRIQGDAATKVIMVLKNIYCPE